MLAARYRAAVEGPALRRLLRLVARSLHAHAAVLTLCDAPDEVVAAVGFGERAVPSPEGRTEAAGWTRLPLHAPGLAPAASAVMGNAGTAASTADEAGADEEAAQALGPVVGALAVRADAPPDAAARADAARAMADHLAAAYRAEAEARRAEQLLASVFDVADIGICVTDAHGRFVDVNEAYCRTYGYDRDELVGHAFTKVLPEADRARLQDLHDAFIAGAPESAGEHVVQRKDGALRTVHVTAARLTRDDGARFKVTTVTDVTERRAREEELRRAKNEAEAMNRLKSALLANMSHEIRTPLTAILGFAEVLEDEVEGQSRRFTQVIVRSAHRLMRTLNSVLDLARIEAGEMPPQPTTFDLVAQVNEAVGVLRPMAKRKGLTLHVEMPPAPLDVWLDADALARILDNLVGNAIKFTKRGRITLRVEATSDAVTLRVADTGVGIQPAFLPHVFEAFKQESTGLGRDFEGTGLGLRITQHLVRMMGGDIEVTSTPGEGSTFTVTLPRTLDDALLPQPSGDGAPGDGAADDGAAGDGAASAGGA